jgi:hypothetical protein
MPKARVIKVNCQCGEPLFRYYKGGRGRLIKCFLDEIRQDHIGIQDKPLGAHPTCPRCGKDLGEIRIVRGQPALKINQGTIQSIRI